MKEGIGIKVILGRRSEALPGSKRICGRKSGRYESQETVSSLPKDSQPNGEDQPTN